VKRLLGRAKTLLSLSQLLGSRFAATNSTSVDDQVFSIDFRNLSLCLTEKVGLARGKEGQMNLYLKSKVKTSVSTA
jgi:hypothetical protein